METAIKDLVQVNKQLQEKKDSIAQGVLDDFKMVTFSLGGKDYGVDIMNIKEIAKADKYTYVPNAPSFVRGVYNLRGDIIPIIDLRVFFHLPTFHREEGQDNMLILHIGDRVYGTVVDKIDKVVGIQSEKIQAPHPIFGDINIKYIKGVVEKTGSLFIILDVVRIFGSQTEASKAVHASADAINAAINVAREVSDAPPVAKESTSEELGFIKDQLLALKKFTASDLNDEWLIRRLDQWKAEKSGANVQLKNEGEAAQFLEPFFSPHSGVLWGDEYAYALKALLPDLSSNNIQAWNPGCGKGYETYSFACILKMRYPSAHIKIWANDSDIMAIANAPNMVFSDREAPDFCKPFLVKGKNGMSFNQTIKDSIVFEYHDIANENTLPDLDLVFCRDTLSFLPAGVKENILGLIAEKLKQKGMVMLGQNEKMQGWQSLGRDRISAFVKV
jgi:purine-binding chemotaxis protein CheW